MPKLSALVFPEADRGTREPGESLTVELTEPIAVRYGPDSIGNASKTTGPKYF